MYQSVTAFRNFLFDHRIWVYKPTKFDIYTISVGNLTVGGTGKTPMIEYLIHLLKSKYKIATISRGYGRKTKGIIMADDTSTPETIGDEPAQFYRKFAPQVHVMVGEQRSVAIPRLLSQHPETQVILLDDAYQHRWVLPHLNILLTDYNRLFFKDYVLPMGLLRESRNGANRADVIVITKCPEELDYKKEYIKLKLSNYITKPKVPLFFTNLKYGAPIPIYNPALFFDSEADILLFCGIANPKPLLEYLESNFNLVKTEAFADHYSYKLKDIDQIIAIFSSMGNNKKCMLTTEKDMVKLVGNQFEEKLKGFPVFYVPIEVNFMENENAFRKLILKGLK